MQSDIFSPGVCRRPKRPVTHTLSLELDRVGIFVLSPADTGEQSRISGAGATRRNVAGLDPRQALSLKEKTPHIVRYSPATLRG